MPPGNAPKPPGNAFMPPGFSLPPPVKELVPPGNAGLPPVNRPPPTVRTVPTTGFRPKPAGNGPMTTGKGPLTTVKERFSGRLLLLGPRDRLSWPLVPKLRAWMRGHRAFRLAFADGSRCPARQSYEHQSLPRAARLHLHR